MGWLIKKLGDICNIELGKTPARSNKKYWDEEKKTNNVWLSISDLPSSLKPTVSDSKEYISNTGAELSKIVPKGTLIVSFKLTLGRLAFTGRDLFTNEAIAALYIKSDTEINKDYLYWYLTYFDWEAAAGSDIKVKGKTLNKSKLKDIDVIVPTISEQNHIVTILENIFSEIGKVLANAELNLKSARELFDGYLRQIFSNTDENWKEKTLKQVALDFGRGKSKHRPRNDPSLYDGEYPFIQTGDVRNSEHIITTYSKTYNETGLAQSKLWPKGTVCITIAANIAETGILDFDACFPDSVIGLVIDPEVTTTRYLEFLLQSFKAILQAKGQGAAQDNINLGTFENMTFPFPALQVQEQIIDKLDSLMLSVQELESIYTSKIIALDELKQSVLQKAFTGELTRNKDKDVAA